MGKRKGRKENQQPIHSERDEDGGGGDEKGAGFFSCYLLTSICPRFKGHTYIGFTVNPRRRIRQHNGEIGSGAWRTKRKRPWEMVLCIYGFPTNVAALQFEWAWQHPVESLAVRSAAASFKSLSGLANKIKLAYTMLTLPAWQSLNLTVNLFSTKYQKHNSGCPTLPEQMRTKICSMDDLPCYNASDCPIDNDDDDDECEGLFQESTEPESSARISEDYPNYKSSPEEYIHQEIELSGCSSRMWAEWPKQNSPPIREEEEEDHGQFFIVNDSPERTSFSDIAEKAQNPRLTELNTKFDEPLEKQSATPLVAAEKDEVLIMSPNIMSHGVEIIDIFTPSPCYRVNSGRKKRKPNLFPEVIDLTNSPMYV